MASNSVSKSVVWQLAGKIFLQGIAFFTVPVFTRLLTPADFGYTALYTSWLSIFGLILGLQVHGSISNARIKYPLEEIYKYFSSIMTLAVISFLILLTLSIVFNQWLSKTLGLRNDLVILLVIHSFAVFIISFQITKLDQFKKVEKSTFISFIQSILIIGTSLIAVLIAKNNKAIFRLYGQAIPTILIGLPILIVIYFRGKKLWNTEYIRFCLTLTLPLIIHGIGHLIFTQSDRLMLQKIQDETTLGIYSVAYSLCNLLMVIYGALNTSWVPFYFDFKKQQNNKAIITHTKRYLKFFTLLCIGFLLLSFDVFKLMAPQEYWSGIKLIPLFVLSFYFGFLYLFPVNYEFYHCRTKLIPVATIVAAIINITLNYFFIPRYSMIGAAFSTFVAHVLLFVFHWITAKYIIREAFEYNFKMFIPGIVLVFFSCIAVNLIQEMWYIRWGIACLLGVYMLKDIIKNRSIF
jgi:O-antigen/teichoic acid export membrane protein